MEYLGIGVDAFGFMYQTQKLRSKIQCSLTNFSDRNSPIVAKKLATFRNLFKIKCFVRPKFGSNTRPIVTTHII